MTAPPPEPTQRALRWSYWQSAARVRRLARKELLDIVRDRRTIFTLVLMPLLLYPLLSFAFRQFLITLLPLAQENRPLTIGVAKKAPKDDGPSAKQIVEKVLDQSREPELRRARALVTPKGFPPVALVEVNDLNVALKAGDIDVAVLVVADPLKNHANQWEFRIVYNDRVQRARKVADYLSDRIALADARELQAHLESVGVPRYITKDLVRYRVVRDTDVIEQESAAPQLSLTAVVPLILILMTITGAVYPAIDLTAGERERGTLEILVAAPVPRMSLLLAKYIAVVCVAMLTAAINLAMMLITLEFNGLTNEVFHQTEVNITLVLQLLFLLCLFAVFFSAVLLTLTSFARSFKEAQAYLIPLILVSLAPGVLGMMPGLRLAGVWMVMPLVNIVLLARDLSDGAGDAGTTALVVFSTLVYALTALAGAARVFGAEAVLYSEQSNWGDLFRRPRETRPAASVAGAMLCMALLFPALFLVTGPSSLTLDVYGQLAFMVLVSCVLYVGFPVLGLWRGRIDPVSGLQLRRPPWIAWPAAAVLGLAAVPLIYYLTAWMHTLGVTFMGPGAEMRMVETVRRWREVPWAALASALALTGIAEEVFFRGFLFSALRAATERRVTIVGSAVLFGLLHAATALDRLVPSTVMGLLLGWVCWNTRSVLPCMVLHAAFNAGFVGATFYVAGKTAAPGGLGYRNRLIAPFSEFPLAWTLTAIPAGLAALGLIYWFRVRSRRRAAEVVERQP